MDFKKPVEFMSEIRKTEHFPCNFGTFPAVLAIFSNFTISERSGLSSNRCNRVQILIHNKQTK